MRAALLAAKKPLSLERGMLAALLAITKVKNATQAPRLHLSADPEPLHLALRVALLTYLIIDFLPFRITRFVRPSVIMTQFVKKESKLCVRIELTQTPVLQDKIPEEIRARDTRFPKGSAYNSRPALARFEDERVSINGY